MSVPRMRTIQDAVKYLRGLDPETAIGEGWIRRQMKNGTLPFVWAGRKQLINLDVLLAYLETGSKTMQPPPAPVKVEDDEDDYHPPRMKRIEVRRR